MGQSNAGQSIRHRMMKTPIPFGGNAVPPMIQVEHLSKRFPNSRGGEITAVVPFGTPDCSHLTGTDVFNKEIYFLATLPAIVEPGDVILVVAMALCLSFLATIYPAWRAARLDPVEALRYE